LPGSRITPGQKKKYYQFRAEGNSIVVAAQRAGFSESTAMRVERQTRIAPEWSASAEAREMMKTTRQYHELKAEAQLPGPIPLNKLKPEAKRALDDFGYFRERYFGRISMPWQLSAIADLEQLLHTDDREFVDLNEPPGSGKSTLLADFKAWLICRDRTVRILTGSATQPLAQRQLMRVRRSLERMTPLIADPKEVAKGITKNAESTLARDFGRFKPLDRELWSRDAFIVMQHDGMGAIEDKEATCTAYGIDTEFTGGRFDYVEWDDLVSPRQVSSAQYRADLESIYVKTCEARVEPSGLMVLSGQRLASDDLHRFVLDLVRPSDDIDEDEPEMVETAEADRSNMKYRHIVFKAHYEDRCSNNHAKTAPPYPEGCLLDPRRLPWRDLASAQANNPAEYSLVYQQEDADPDQALVKREWVYGDEDHLGCVDYDRGEWEIPTGVSYNDCVVFATADPSPTQFWSVQCWAYHEPSKSMILLAHIRKKMRMPEMLDRDIHGNFSGVMEEWRKTSDGIGFPISTWIIEHNAAQRFMLQQSLMRDWRLTYGIEVRPHSTTLNKADPHYGVWTMSNLWRLGRVRLPMSQGDSRINSMRIIEEVLVYDHGRTDDCVMAMWMGHWNLPDMALPEDTSTPIDRPSWVLEAAF
jgi:hypothetical protein